MKLIAGTEVRRPRIDIEGFKIRHEIEARARAHFYKDVDAGLMKHLPGDWSAIPQYLQQLYLSVEQLEYEYALKHQAPTTVRQNRWYHKIAALFSLEGRS